MHTDVFAQHRQRLFGIAYRMLGSRVDAEDVLQDVYLVCSSHCERISARRKSLS